MGNDPYPCLLEFIPLNDSLMYRWDLWLFFKKQESRGHSKVENWEKENELKPRSMILSNSQGRQSCWHIPLGVRHWMESNPEINECRDSERWEVCVSWTWILNLFKQGMEKKRNKKIIALYRHYFIPYFPNNSRLFQSRTIT